MGWIIAVWLLIFGASWFHDARDSSWFGYVLLVLAILLMHIGPGVFRSLAGCIIGGIPFMVVSILVIVHAWSVQTIMLDARGQTVTATVGMSVEEGYPGPPHVCEPGTGEVVNQINIPADVGISRECLNAYGIPDGACRNSCAQPLPPGTRLEVRFDPEHLVTPFSVYRPPAFYGLCGIRVQRFCCSTRCSCSVI